MYKICLTLIILTFFGSCKPHEIKARPEKNNNQIEEMGSQYLVDLYNRRYQDCIAKMDDLVISAAKDINLDSSFGGLSDKIRKEFGAPINAVLVSSEKTFHENLPATFSIFRVETATKFGYYFFIINEKSGKILFISEFSRIRAKRF